MYDEVIRLYYSVRCGIEDNSFLENEVSKISASMQGTFTINEYSFIVHPSRHKMSRRYDIIFIEAHLQAIQNNHNVRVLATITESILVNPRILLISRMQNPFVKVCLIGDER